MPVDDKRKPQIYIATDFSEWEFTRLAELIGELYPARQPLTREAYLRILKSESVTLFLSTIDDIIVGTATLVTYLKPGGMVGVIEDVVVGEAFRGLGVGSELTRAMIVEGTRQGAEVLDVNTRRDSARLFYEQLGFEQKGLTRDFYSLRYYMQKASRQ